jgi:hypothetical protein
MLQASAGVQIVVYGVALFGGAGGIAVLAAEITMRAISGPGPQLLTVTPSTAALGVLPLVLFPTYLVPFSIVLHAVSLRALAAARTAVRAYS